MRLFLLLSLSLFVAAALAHAQQGKRAPDLAVDAPLSGTDAHAPRRQRAGRAIFPKRVQMADASAKAGAPLHRLTPAGMGEAANTYRTHALGARFAMAYAVASLPDGAFLLAGYSHAPAYLDVPGAGYDDQSIGIALARLRPDGTPDPAFGASGRVFTFVPTAGGRDVTSLRATSVAALSGGAFLVSGFARLDDGSEVGLVLRYRANGTLDTSFGTDGVAALRVPGATYTFFDAYTGLVVQPDGHIVVAGSVFDSAGNDFIVARFTPDGTLDTGFGTQGVARRDFDGRNDRAEALVSVPGGGFAVAGRSIDRQTSRSDVALWRLDANGASVPTFGTNGGVRITSGEGSQQAWGLLAQADGRLVVAGSRNVTNTQPYFTLLLRVDASGNVENGFGNGNADGLTQRGALFTLASDAQGRIYAASDFPGAVVRFSASGAHDPSYAGNTHPSALYGLALDAQGRAVGVGLSVYQSGRAFHAARFTPNGALDASFGTGGVVRVPIWNGNFGIRRVFAEAGGAALVAGTVSLTDQDLGVARFTSAGRLDEAYADGGVYRTPVGTGDDYPEAFARTADGRLWVVSACEPAQFASSFYCDGGEDFAVLRLMPDGSPDPSLGSGGRAFFDLKPDDRYEDWYFENVSLLPGGGALLIGEMYDGTDDTALLLRLNADGTRAAGFGQNGVMRQPGDGVEFIEALELADGHLLVSGSLYNDNTDEESAFLARYTAAGVLDRTYGQSGLLTLDPFATCEETFVLYLRARVGGAEALVFADCGTDGDDDDNFAIAAVRLDAAGNLTGTPVVYDTRESGLTGLYIDGIDALVWERDGTLVAAGTRLVRDGFDERLALSVVKLRPDGSADAGWGTGGRVTFLLDGYTPDDEYDVATHGLVPQPDGTYLVVGQMPGTQRSFGFELARYDNYEVFTALVASTGVVSSTTQSGQPVAARTVQAAPNPLSAYTAVTITLGALESVIVVVYDVLGREVAELYRGSVPAGTHRLRWEPGPLPSGLYFVRLETPSGTMQQALHVMR